MHDEIRFGIVKNADAESPRITINIGRSFIYWGRINIEDLTGGSHVMAEPTIIANMNRSTIGIMISIFSLIEIIAGPVVGPHTVTILSRIEYRDVNPTLIIDRSVSGRLFCIFIADSIIMSLE